MSVLYSCATPSFLAYLKDLWYYRHAFRALLVRQFKIRYAQSRLGLLWSVLQPLIYAVILVLIFNRVANLDNDGGGNPLGYALLGLFVWIWFSNAVSYASSISLGMRDVMSKIYFPRVFLPLVAFVEASVDAGVVLILSIVFSGWSLQAHLLFFIPAILAFSLLVIAAAMITTMLVLRFADSRFIIPFVLRILFFATPIAYSTTMLKSNAEYLLYLNPVIGWVDIFRFIAGLTQLDYALTFYSLILACCLFAYVIYRFLLFERLIGDYV